MAEEVKTEKKEEQTPKEKEVKKDEVEVTPEPEVTTLSEEEKQKLGEEKEPEEEKKVEEQKPSDEDYGKKVQKRINKLTKEKYELLKRAETAEAKVKQSFEAPTPTAIIEKPNREKYETVEEYDEALVNYQVDQRLQKQKVEDTKVKFEADKKKSEEDVKVEKKRRDDSYELKATDIRKKHEDFNAVAHASDVPYSNFMQHLVLTSDIGPELAYYFGNNRDEAMRVAKLEKPDDVIEAIGEIETKLALEPEKKKITNAPPPINPVGGSEVVEIDLENASYEDFRAKRIKDLREVAKRGG